MLSIIILFVATSCKKHLNRDDAKKQIITSENYPVVADYDITKSYTKDQHTEGNGVTVVLGEDEFKKKISVFELFERNKLIKCEEIPQREESTQFLLGTTVRTWTVVNVSLTDEGKKYLIQDSGNIFKVRLWEINIDNITGIQEMEEEKRAKVDYTVSNKNITPFGAVFSDKGNTIQKTVYFSLYDDGWRIQK